MSAPFTDLDYYFDIPPLPKLETLQGRAVSPSDLVTSSSKEEMCAKVTYLARQSALTDKDAHCLIALHGLQAAAGNDAEYLQQEENARRLLYHNPSYTGVILTVYAASLRRKASGLSVPRSCEFYAKVPKEAARDAFVLGTLIDRDAQRQKLTQASVRDEAKELLQAYPSIKRIVRWCPMKGPEDLYHSYQWMCEKLSGGLTYLRLEQFREDYKPLLRTFNRALLCFVLRCTPLERTEATSDQIISIFDVDVEWKELGTHEAHFRSMEGDFW